jgi:diguanylate cyclase (GGDEF)-like protein
MSAAAPTPPPPKARLPEPWEPSTMRLKQGDTVAHGLAEADQPHACLILYSGDDAGKRFALSGPRMVLGRSPECEICIESPSVSRCHAEVQQQGEHFVLLERGSANGTHVNSMRIATPTVLRDGDVIRLGHMALKFYERQSLDALLHDRIYRMATVDEGTEVFTKRYLLEALEREIRRAHRTQRPLCLVCLDLDHFKQVNDQFGHNGGDVVLRAVATAVKAQLRGCDILGRMGGEEFAVVLPETELGTAAALAERVRAAVAAELFLLPAGGADGAERVQHQQTASLGVAQLLTTMPDARALLALADQMLYAAKHGGRNGVRF